MPQLEPEAVGGRTGGALRGTLLTLERGALRPILVQHSATGDELRQWDLTEEIGLGYAGYDTLYFPKAFLMTKLSRGVAVGAFGENNDEIHLARVHVP